MIHFRNSNVLSSSHPYKFLRNSSIQKIEGKKERKKKKRKRGRERKKDKDKTTTMMKAVMAKAGTRGLSRARCGRRSGSVRWLQTAFVGLPNVGKSSLFNAVMKAKAKAEAANFPFCTIDPNVGRVAVPDDKLRALGELMESEKVVPTFLEFVDVAGLVKGAADGEGWEISFSPTYGNVTQSYMLCGASKTTISYTLTIPLTPFETLKS